MASYFNLHVCPTCAKSYKRPEHLRRHQVSHGTERPHQCTRCGNSFQRSDVLKRHLKTCDSFIDHPDLSPEPSSKRRALSNSQTLPQATPSFLVAHDHDPGHPPSTDQDILFHDSSTQSFSHIAGWVSCGLLNHDFDGASDSWQDFLNWGPGTPNPDSAMPREEQRDNGALNFLANFTSMSGLSSSFDCGTLEQRWKVATSFRDAASQTLDSVILTRSDPAVAVGGAVTASSTNEDYISHPAIRQWLSDPLSLKSHEIITSIKDIVQQKSKGSCVELSWSTTVEETCLQFFSPTNIRRYLYMYWAIWHPNVNIVHKATFNPAALKPELIAAMSVIGACVSPDPSDLENAKRWFNCVEDMVFSDDDLCDDRRSAGLRDTGETQWWRGKLRSLQAAYMVCLYQNWEGNYSSKCRIRRYRYSTVVSAARDTGFHNARHPGYWPQNLCDFSFNNFAAREELIRVLLWIFLLDTAFVIFNNLPPRMVIREMKMSMAKPESCFQAMTAEECFHALQQQSPDTALQPMVSLDFVTAFELLYHVHLDDALSTTLADLGPINLFAITSALHSLIFHYQNSFSCQGSLSAIQRALKNWEAVWNVYMTRLSEQPRHSPVTSSMHDLVPDDMWKRIGFTRHASEYWLLAKLMVERLSKSNEENMEAVAVSAGLAQSPASASGTDSIGPLLNQYDQTSMEQVNILIADLQRVCIQLDSKD